MFSKKNNYLKEIIATLNDNSVDYIICGGVALVLHGVERMTMDLDLSVGMDEGNLKRFLQSMKKLGLTPRAPVPSANSTNDSPGLPTHIGSPLSSTKVGAVARTEELRAIRSRSL